MKRTQENFYTNLQKKLGIQNVMEVPRVTKVVLNMGLGEAVTNKNAVQHSQEQLSLIANQKAVVTKARKSISAFKVRMGFPIGVKVTLRGKRMYAFLDRVIAIIIPRKRDFRGITESSVDQNGNLNLGFTEQTIFPEIEFDSVDRIRGLQVTAVTNTTNKEHARALFEEMGIPFANQS